jgi:SAF domain
VDVPAPPPARRLRPPSWFAPRTLTGLLLIVVSVATGAKVVAGADRSIRVWALSRDVAAGTVLADADLRIVRVRLFDAGPAYLSAADLPTGRSVTRDLREGELLPAAAVRTTPAGVVVNVPVPTQNAPAVARGDAVDVWAGRKGCAPVRILAGAAVQEVRADGGGALASATGSMYVVVRLAPVEADRLLAALGAEATVRLVVVDGDVGARSVAPLPACRGGAAGTGSADSVDTIGATEEGAGG